MTPTFTLRYPDGACAQRLSTLHAAMIAYEEMGDRYPTAVYVEVPNRCPRAVRGFTAAGVPLVLSYGDVIPLY